MFASLPETIKQRILQLLEQRDFVTAKLLRDHWLKKLETEQALEQDFLLEEAEVEL